MEPTKFELVTRDRWGAMPSVGEIEPLSLPLQKVYISMTTDSPSCDCEEACFKVLRQLQNKAIINLGLPDIQYNFLVGTDGKVYEGRGWHKKPEIAKSKLDYMDKTLDIAYIGTHDEDNVPIMFHDGAFELLLDGVAKKYLYIGTFDFIYSDEVKPEKDESIDEEVDEFASTDKGIEICDVTDEDTVKNTDDD